MSPITRDKLRLWLKIYAVAGPSLIVVILIAGHAWSRPVRPMTSNISPQVAPPPRSVESLEGVVRGYWDPAQGGNGDTFEIVTLAQPISWMAARRAAEARGGRLATITSEAKSRFVWSLSPQRTTRNGGGVWLGGYRDPPDSNPNLNWHWITGEAWSYTQWQPYADYPNVDLSHNFLKEFHDYADRDGWGNVPNMSSNIPVYSYAVEYDVRVPEATDRISGDPDQITWTWPETEITLTPGTQTPLDVENLDIEIHSTDGAFFEEGIINGKHAKYLCPKWGADAFLGTTWDGAKTVYLTPAIPTGPAVHVRIRTLRFRIFSPSEK